MSPFRLIPVCAGLAAAVGLASPAKALPVPNTAKLHSHTHHHHLQSALKDIQEAAAAVKANNGPVAQRELTTAIAHLEHAIHHHQQYQLIAVPNGLGGLTVTAVHQTHRSHLDKAMHNARAALKQIAAGHPKKALDDVHAAGKQTRAAIAHHPNW
jgi:hypothetical protein